MAEIHITGQKMLKSINAEFQAAFPYLRLTFCSMDDWKKANGKGGTIYGFDMNQRLSAVRVKQGKEGTGDICIHGRTLVKNLESAFYKAYGICCQVSYNEKDGQRYYTSGRYDDLTLTQLNKELETRGCVKNPK